MPIYYERIPEPFPFPAPFPALKIIFITEERRTPWGQLISRMQTKATFFADDSEMEQKVLREYSLQKLPQREMPPPQTIERQQNNEGRRRRVMEEGEDFWETKTTTEYFGIPPSFAAAASPSPESMAFGEHWSARGSMSPHSSEFCHPNRGTMSRQTLLREALRMRREE